MEGTLVIWILRKEDSMFLIQILRLESTPLIWATPFVGSLYKESRRKNGACSFFACLLSACQLFCSFAGIGAYFLGIPAYTEDKLKHPTSRDWAAVIFLRLSISIH